jgi:hypothetical protein
MTCISYYNSLPLPNKYYWWISDDRLFLDLHNKEWKRKYSECTSIQCMYTEINVKWLSAISTIQDTKFCTIIWEFYRKTGPGVYLRRNILPLVELAHRS